MKKKTSKKATTKPAAGRRGRPPGSKNKAKAPLAPRYPWLTQLQTGTKVKFNTNPDGGTSAAVFGEFVAETNGWVELRDNDVTEFLRADSIYSVRIVCPREAPPEEVTSPPTEPEEAALESAKVSVNYSEDTAAE